MHLDSSRNSSFPQKKKKTLRFLLKSLRVNPYLAVLTEIDLLNSTVFKNAVCHFIQKYARSSKTVKSLKTIVRKQQTNSKIVKCQKLFLPRKCFEEVWLGFKSV